MTKLPSLSSKGILFMLAYLFTLFDALFKYALVNSVCSSHDANLYIVKLLAQQNIYLDTTC